MGEQKGDFAALFHSQFQNVLQTLMVSLAALYSINYHLVWACCTHTHCMRNEHAYILHTEQEEAIVSKDRTHNIFFFSKY